MCIIHSPLQRSYLNNLTRCNAMRAKVNIQRAQLQDKPYSLMSLFVFNVY